MLEWPKRMTGSSFPKCLIVAKIQNTWHRHICWWFVYSLYFEGKTLANAGPKSSSRISSNRICFNEAVRTWTKIHTLWSGPSTRLSLNFSLGCGKMMPASTSSKWYNCTPSVYSLQSIASTSFPRCDDYNFIRAPHHGMGHGPNNSHLDLWHIVETWIIADFDHPP